VRLKNSLKEGVVPVLIVSLRLFVQVMKNHNRSMYLVMLLVTRMLVSCFIYSFGGGYVIYICLIVKYLESLQVCRMWKWKFTHSRTQHVSLFMYDGWWIAWYVISYMFGTKQSVLIVCHTCGNCSMITGVLWLKYSCVYKNNQAVKKMNGPQKAIVKKIWNQRWQEPISTPPALINSWRWWPRNDCDGQKC